MLIDNRPFHDFLTFDMDQLGKSVNTTGRVPQKLVKLSNLKVITLKQAKIQLWKVAKNLQTSVWWEGVGGGASL